MDFFKVKEELVLLEKYAYLLDPEVEEEYSILERNLVRVRYIQGLLLKEKIRLEGRQHLSLVKNEQLVKS